jgi:hypothetical protein
MEHMSDDDDNNQVCAGRHENGPRQRLCDEEIQWSLRRNLWPNWILQFAFSLILCCFGFMAARGYGSNTTILYVALVVLSFSLMTHLTDATHPEYSAERLTYATGGVLFFLPVYEIYYSFKKDSTRISLRHYLKFQMAKVEILYLLLDLVVWGWGEWELGFMNCVRNFVYVVLLSILLG